MSTALYFREDLDTTLASLVEDLAGGNDTRTIDVDVDRIRVHGDSADPTIAVGDVALPVTGTALDTLASALQVPSAYFKRIGERGGLPAQSTLLNLTLDNSPGGVVRAEYVEDGALLDLRDPHAMVIPPANLVRMATRVLGSDESPVQRIINTSDMFAFDVHVPFDSDRGVGGDSDSLVDVPENFLRYSWASGVPVVRDSRVGDLTAAGIRVALDRKRNLAPTVQPWMMRLACTNGMETTTEMTKVDARGMTVDDVLADLERKAEIAFSRLEQQMAHFYELRDDRVENPERRLRAIARERRVPNRTLMRMLDAAPEALGGSTSEFDVLNFLSNHANDQANDGGRLLLERAAGAIVQDHSVRCSRCQHALVD